MKTTVLFLAADPSDASRLRLGQEHREILGTLKLAAKREQFILEERLSVRPGDVVQAIFDVAPQIVHFAAHGKSTGEICLENAMGRVEPVQPKALARLFSLVAEQVKCVVLNACYSEIQAQSIAEYIDYVVGMRTIIPDQTSIAFSVGFYRALGAGRSFEKAYEHAITELELMNLPDYEIPVLEGRKIRKKQSVQTLQSHQKPQISRKYIVSEQFHVLLRKTIIGISAQDVAFIDYGISHQTINRIDVFALNTKDECKAQLNLSVDWVTYQPEQSGTATLLASTHDHHGLAIEIDESISLFNKYTKENSFFAVWRVNSPESLILDRWGNTPRDSVSYKIPELPELTVSISLSVEGETE